MEQVEALFGEFLNKWKVAGSSLRWDDSLKRWTETVLKCFRDMGKERKYEVFPDPENEDDYYRHQYLSLDQCWTKEESADPYWMQLALESEWLDHKEVKEDFWKLTELKCPWKVMVYAEERTETRFIETLNTIVGKHRFKAETEQYLVIVFRKDASLRERGGYSISGSVIQGTGGFSEIWEKEKVSASEGTG